MDSIDFRIFDPHGPKRILVFARYIGRSINRLVAYLINELAYPRLRGASSDMLFDFKSKDCCGIVHSPWYSDMIHPKERPIGGHVFLKV